MTSTHGNTTPSESSTPKPNSDAAPTPRTVTSQELLQGRIEVLIAHGPDTYRLRVTRSGKLILQK